MPATKTKKNQAAQAAVTAEYEQAYEQAELVMRDALASGRKLTFDEGIFVKQALGLSDEKALRDELRRVGRVIDCEQISGTAADRKAAEKLAKEAAEKLAAEGPAIEQQIAELTAMLAQMQRDQRTSEKRFSEMQAAAEQTRAYVPKHIERRYNEEKCRVKETLGRVASDLKIELMEAKTLGGVGGVLSVNSKQFVDVVRSRFGQKFDRVMTYATNVERTATMRHLVFDAKAYEQTRQQFVEKIPRLEAELAEAEEQFQTELAKCESMRDFYLTK